MVYIYLPWLALVQSSVSVRLSSKNIVYQHYCNDTEIGEQRKKLFILHFTVDELVLDQGKNDSHISYAS